MSNKIDNWDAHAASFQEDAWTKVMCGCPDCLKSNSYYDKSDSRNHLTKYTCKKIKQYTDSLPVRNHFRAINELKPNAFKPASNSQIEEWATWLSSPITIEAEKILIIETDKYKNYKFNSANMQKELERCWPNQKLLLVNSVKWNMYEKYTNEQKKLLKKYDGTEKAHNELLAHINSHGQLIDKIPVYEHKKLDDSSNLPRKLGRRAARHAREDSPDEKSYTRAELRHMVRASENKEAVPEEVE